MIHRPLALESWCQEMDSKVVPLALKATGQAWLAAGFGVWLDWGLEPRRANGLSCCRTGCRECSVRPVIGSWLAEGMGQELLLVAPEI